MVASLLGRLVSGSRLAAIACATTLALPGVAAAGSTPVAQGSALTLFAPDSSTNDYAEDVGVAQAGDGSAEVVWTQKIVTSINTPYSGLVYFRRIAADGSMPGPAEQVDTAVSPDTVQVGPSVAADAAGNFVVTWIEQEVHGYYQNYKARLFNADGTPRTPTFDVSSNRVLMQDNGSFAVVAYDVVSRYAADGTLQATQQLSLTETNVREILYAMNRQSGSLAVLTLSQADKSISSTAYSSKYSVQLDQFDASGKALGKTATPVTCWYYSLSRGPVGCKLYSPRIAKDTAGHTVVSWVKSTSKGEQLYARSYSDQNSTQSKAFSIFANLQSIYPGLAAGSNGTFVSAATAYTGTGWSVYGQSFNFDGSLNGSTFAVYPGYGGYPVMDANASGDLMLLWSATPTPPMDALQYVVYGQRYLLP